MNKTPKQNQDNLFNKVDNEHAIPQKKNKTKKHKKSHKNKHNDGHPMPKMLENAFSSNYKGPVPHELLGHLPALGEQGLNNQMMPQMMPPQMPNMNIQDMGNQMAMDNALMGNSQHFSNLMANQQENPLMSNFMGNEGNQMPMNNNFMGNPMHMPNQMPQQMPPQMPMDNNFMGNPMQMPNQMPNQMPMDNNFMGNPMQFQGGKRQNKNKKNKLNDNDFFFLRGEHQK